MTLKYSRNCWIFNVEKISLIFRLIEMNNYTFQHRPIKQLKNNKTKMCSLFRGLSHITEFA